ncbi:metal dependent phosphohydrolase [Calothrix sp. NIES-4071]|nr:metal dependent phosphohydrolase [Calothrix sp. NIES-4071]BAZ55141.1 metal dependent phosphohydrolase [Calothrix sp. NIES-4105]
MILFRKFYRQTALKGRRSHLNNRLYSASILVFVILSLSSGLGYRFYNQPKLDVDKIAPQTLTAPSSANVEDVKTTEERRRKARSGALAVWIVDPEANEQIHQNLQKLLSKGNQIRKDLGSFPFVKTSVLSTATQTYLRQVPETQWQVVSQTLDKNSSPARLELAQQIALKELRIYRESTSSQAFSQLLKTIVRARQRYTTTLTTLKKSPSNQSETLYNVTFLNLSDTDWQQTQIQVRQTLDRMLTQGIYPGISEDNIKYAIQKQVSVSVPITAQPLARQLLSAVIVPNLIQDIKQTKLIAEQAAQAVEPTIVSIQKGEVIVNAGEKITQIDFVLLDHFHLSQRGIDWLHLIGFSVMVALAVAVFRLVERRIYPKLAQSDYILILLLTLCAPLLIALTKSFTGLPAIGLLLGSFYGTSIGGTVMVLITILISIGTELNWHYLVPSATGGILGGLIAGQWRFPDREAPRTREELASLGILIGLTQGVVYLLANTTVAPLWYTVLGSAALNGLAGLLWSILALGLSPYLEALFDLVTPIRLAELSNPNRPLLKRLAHEAPGTFQHTLFVATLAETAARALNCNVELVRAGVLYHDIGKMHDPLAFIENQMGSPNKHDAINDPWVSAEIIKKHVSEGLLIARQYKLPSAVQAFIPEHQGTILIAYFYQEAQQRKEQYSEKVLYESDFRYDGPIPESKETGIVMLADACEAALRSLKDATPEAALGMVNKILKARWQDNQLVDSRLTREEMSQIAHIFVQVWQQFHHKRIAYR